MINIYIKAPIWKTESIGVNKKIIKDDLLIEITYTKADGERLYPHVYYMRKDIALRYPIQEVSGGVKLHIIPIHDLTVLTKDQIEYAQYCQAERIPFRIQYEPKVVPPEPKTETIDLPGGAKGVKISESVQQRMDWVNN